MILIQKTKQSVKYYSVALYPTLFDDYVLVHHCGQNCSRRSKRIYYKNKKEALLESLNIITAKKAEGFELFQKNAG